jgi:hypothetical protein
MAGGRPSKYSDKLAEEICRRLGKGEPMARICDDDHMPSYNTIWRWENENAEFRELSARAKQNGTHFLADDTLRIADDDTIDTQRAKLMIDTRLRLIGKWNAKAYGDKLQQEVSGPDGGALSVTWLKPA